MIFKSIFTKCLALGICFIALSTAPAVAQQMTAAGFTIPEANKEQGIISLSKAKWKWMSDKSVDTLNVLFHDKSMYVHMGGSWGKERELEVIKSGGIHYKHAEIFETSVQFIGKTAIVLTRIRLLAVVGGNEVTNPFMVTEVYVSEGGAWKLGVLSFTRLVGQ